MDEVQTAERVNEHYWRWLQFPRGTGVLHRISVMDVCGDDDEDNWPYAGRGAIGKTACGRQGLMFMPGIFSRLGAHRCAKCCRAVNVPVGDGVPFNDKALTPEEQER